MTNEDALYELYEALGSQDNPMNAEAARRYMAAIDALSASTGSADSMLSQCNRPACVLEIMEQWKEQQL